MTEVNLVKWAPVKRLVGWWPAICVVVSILAAAIRAEVAVQDFYARLTRMEKASAETNRMIRVIYQHEQAGGG